MTSREEQILVLERRNKYVLIFSMFICPGFGENVLGWKESKLCEGKLAQLLSVSASSAHPSKEVYCRHAPALHPCRRGLLFLAHSQDICIMGSTVATLLLYIPVEVVDCRTQLSAVVVFHNKQMLQNGVGKSSNIEEVFCPA